jgi:hypothetical protein
MLPLVSSGTFFRVLVFSVRKSWWAPRWPRQIVTGQGSEIQKNYEKMKFPFFFIQQQRKPKPLTQKKLEPST